MRLVNEIEREQLEMFALPEYSWRERLTELSVERLKVCVAQVRSAVKVGQVSVIGIGLALMEAKSRLPHGAFGLWLLEEFQWQERTAQRFMAVAREFKDVSVSDLEFLDQTALYVLAGGKSSEDAKQEALARASRGECVTATDARELVEKHSSGNGASHVPVKGLTEGEEFALEREFEKESLGECTQCPRCGHRW